MGAEVNIRSYFSYQHRPPLVLPRRGDADYSVTVFPLGSLRYCLSSEVTPLLSFFSSFHQALPSVPPLRGRLGGGCFQRRGY